jgi:hypothetical protein
MHRWIYSVVQLSCTELKLTISCQARSIFNKDIIFASWFWLSRGTLLLFVKYILVLQLIDVCYC